MSQGQLSNIGICFQNSYGTAKTDSMHWLPHMEDSVSLKKEQIKSEGMRGIFEEGESYEGKNMVDGDIGIEAQAIPLCVLLKAVFGQATMQTSGAIYNHIYKPAQTEWDSLSSGVPFTYHQYLDTGSANQYSDLNGKGLELSIANGELMKAKMSVVGGGFAQIANIAATYGSGKHFTWAVSSLALGGSANAEIVDLTISVDESREAIHSFNNSLYPSRIRRTGQRVVTVNGTLKFDNQTEYQKFINQTEQRMTFHLEGGSLQIQSGYNESVSIDIPSLRYTEFPVAAGGPGELEVSFNADAKYNVGSGTSVQITVVNTHPAF